MKKITLVLGGIRSGKSYFAEQKALYYSEKPIYIATNLSHINDKEMKERVKIHIERRGDKFLTIDEGYDLVKIFDRVYNETVIVDCLTMNLSNRLLKSDSKKKGFDLKELILESDLYLQRIFDVIKNNYLKVIFVSNEVGTSLVSDNKLGRAFQDLQGRWNRIVVENSDEVYYLIAGIPRQIKKIHLNPFKISSPSYLLPTGYIDNVTYLIDKVDDIQLLLFESTKEDELFDRRKSILSTLNYLVADYDKSFTVHMPTTPNLFDENGFEIRIDTTLEIINKLSELKNIKSYTFHYDLPKDMKFEDLSVEETMKIDNTYIAFFSRILKSNPDISISLENTSTPVFALDNVVNNCKINYCIDIGHLLIQKRDLDEILPRLEKTSVVHFHGVKESKDGKIKDHNEILFNRKIFKILENFKGILTIENYHKLKFNKSLKVLEEYF